MVATKHTMIVSGIIPLHLRAEDDTEATKELKHGLPAGAQLPRVNKRTRVRVRRHVAFRRFLLGLPCRTCGAYYGSDERRCPVCKTQQ